jgi:GrpB-like predicted nucleotidyltransferase (UPF0157 family)
MNETTTNAFGSPRVELAPHDPGWARLFRDERRRILVAAPAAVAEVHHVGRTALPGIAAKPVIDVLLLRNRPLDEPEIAALAAPGYEYRGEYGIPGRQYFSRRTPPAFHIHAFVASHPDARAMLRFRDYLLAHPDAARAYEALKLRLARNQRLNRVDYTEAKADFVRRINARALAEQPRPDTF